MVTDDIQIAVKMRAHLAERIGQDRCALWFGPPTQFRLSETGLSVVAASMFTCDWLRRSFAQEVRACCQAVMGREMPVEFGADEALAEAVDVASVPAVSSSLMQSTQIDATATATPERRRTRSAHAVPTGRTPAKPVPSEPSQ